MNSLRKVFVALVLSMGVLTGAALTAVQSLAVLAESGFAVPADAGIVRSLSMGTGEVVELYPVDYEDTVYSSLNGYYVGKDRVAIDSVFPLFINGGAGLRFLDEENWLVSNQVDLLRTYEGLYLNDGYTYTSDLSQADGDEFILLALTNGLYMNAQNAVFSTHVGDREIPANSVIYFNESVLRWYTPEDGHLIFSQEETTFDAKLSIGENTYEYVDFLKALGLIREAIDNKEHNKPAGDQEQEALETLNGGSGNTREPTPLEPGKNDDPKPTGSQGGDPSETTAPMESAEPAPSETPMPGDEEDPGQIGGETQQPVPSGGELPGEGRPGEGEGEIGGGDAEQQPGEGEGEIGGDDTEQQPGQPGEGEGDQNQEENAGGSGSGAGDKDQTGTHGTTDDETDASSGGNTSSGSGGNTDGSGTGSEQGSEAGDPATGSGGTSGDESQSGGGSGAGGSAGSGGSGSSGGGSSGGGAGGSGTGTSGGSTGGTGSSGSGTGTGDTTTEGNQGGGSSGSGGNGGGSSNTDPSEAEDTEGEGSGVSKPVTYQDPEVSLGSFQTWSYAVAAHLSVTDRAGAIQRGVKITIYTKINGMGASYVDEYDNKRWPATGYTGKSTLLRKTYNGSQDLALSTLPPDTTVYVQLSYRYTKEERRDDNDDGTETVTYSRQNVYCDFVELKTKDLSHVQPVVAAWDTEFAARDSALQLNGLTLNNKSNYNAELERFDFDNFKLNTLPYVYRLRLEMTPEPTGESVTITAGSTVMSRAQQEGGTTFLSSTPRLDSNKKYTYKAWIEDRYGNKIPFYIQEGSEQVGSESWSGTVFTQKTAPTVTVEEIENVTDRLTVKVTVKDPDNAMARDENGNLKPLYLRATESDGSQATIYGSWADGSSMGSSTTLSLPLTFDAGRATGDGKSWQLTLESLAFAQVYTIAVSGDYDPQPDAADRETDGSLAPVVEADLGSLRSYTASLSSGSINFSTAVTDLLDTSVTLEATMNTRTTADILPLVDEFRIKVLDNTGKVVDQTILSMEELDTETGYDYNAENTSVILAEGSSTSNRIRLVGEETRYWGSNPWQSILLHQTVNETTGETTNSSPMKLQISLPSGTLKTSTRHTIVIESVVIKSGREYFIPTVLSLSEFTTKKIQPVIAWDDVFVAADVMEFMDLTITDPDGTILEGGLVYVYLYYGDDKTNQTRLMVKNVYASPNPEPVTIRFDGLIAGGSYTLKFVAKAFNDAEGYSSYEDNKTLLELDIVGGSFLSGSLELTALDYQSRYNNSRVVSFTGEQILANRDTYEDIGGKYLATETPAPDKWSRVEYRYCTPWLSNEYYDASTDKQADGYLTPQISLRDEERNKANFVVLPQAVSSISYIRKTINVNGKDQTFDPHVRAWNQSYHLAYIYVVYFDAEGKRLTSYNRPVDDKREWNSSSIWINGGSGRVPGFLVPEGAETVAFVIPDADHLEEAGLLVQFYDTQPVNLFSEANIGIYKVNAENNADPNNEKQWPVYLDKPTFNSNSGTYTEGTYDSGANVGGYVHMLPVTPGRSFIRNFGDTTNNVYLWDENMSLIGIMYLYSSSVFTVPQGVAYVSLPYYHTASSTNMICCMVTDNQMAAGYVAAMNVTVRDTKGYLKKMADLHEGTAHATLTVEQSDSINDPSYYEGANMKGQTFTQNVTLQDEDGDGIWTLSQGDSVKLMTALPANRKWRVTLSAVYKESLVELDSITFQTDGAYTLIHNDLEMLQISGNPYGNYLVVNDFEHRVRKNLTLYGTIDFQSHVITRSEALSNAAGDTSYLITYNYGTIKNLVYDFPRVSDYENTPGCIIYTNQAEGLVENLVIRTYGTVTLSSEARILGIRGNYGTIRNFIIKLGGDVHVVNGTNETGGLLSGYNYGNIEHGYIYADGPYGVLFYRARGQSPAHRSGLFVGYQPPQGKIRDVYSVVDTWYETYDANYAGIICGCCYGEVADIYHVGDFYDYGGAGSNKTYTPLTSTRVGYFHSRNLVDNVSYVSSQSYLSTQANNYYVKRAQAIQLSSVEWQSSILDETAFDIEEPVTMGFYPRLKLPDNMQKYQDYRTLPTVVEQNVPVLVDDQWADPGLYGAPENEEGTILLRFQNDRLATIISAKIAGLTLGEPISQGMASDGLYDVVFKAKVSSDPKVANYLSQYTVSEVVYNNGSGNITQATSYTTHTIEFWKPVATVQDWSAINEKNSWNYRLVSDLDFSDALPLAIIVNNSTTNYTSVGAFNGKIDGDGHKVSNITLSNIQTPWVIARLNTGAVLKNLVVDNMTITSGTSVVLANSQACGGFVGWGYYSTIENVHVINSEVRGQGMLGLLMGYGNFVCIRNCSAADGAVRDVTGTYQIYAGGLVGYMNYESIRSCFVRDVDIDINRSPLVSGVGGLIGYAGSIIIRDCYATGRIKATGSYVGGLIGSANDSWTSAYNCWNDVALDVDGDYVGGVVGIVGQRYGSQLTLGDIVCGGSQVRRGMAFSPSESNMYKQLVWAYANQSVSGVASGDANYTKGLLTAEELRMKTTWTDVMEMGSGYDYSCLAQGNFPKVVDSSGSVVGGELQEDIPLPVVEKYKLYMDQGSASGGNYTVAGRIEHPGYNYWGKSAAEMAAMFQVELQGWSTDEGKISVVLEGQDGYSVVGITTTEKTMALDTYRLTITCENRQVLSAQVNYGEPLYWEIRNITDWNDAMALGRGENGENFRILGLVNFAEQYGGSTTTSYLSLKLGRLEGSISDRPPTAEELQTAYETWKAGSDQSATKATNLGLRGFAGLNYASSYDGAPWIAAVSGNVSGLCFVDMTFDFATSPDAARGMTSAITRVSSLERCYFCNLETKTNIYTSVRSGFISTVQDTACNLIVRNIKLWCSSGYTNGGNYAGALAAVVTNGYKNLDVDTVTVDMKRMDRVGGVFGEVNNLKNDPSIVSSGTFKNLTVYGRYQVGGVVGYEYQTYSQGITIDNAYVECGHYSSTAGTNSGYVGGGGGWAGHQTYTRATQSNFVVKNSTIINRATYIQTSDPDTLSTAYGTGGLFGNSGANGYILRDVRIENTRVEGPYMVGGVGGYVGRYLIDTQVVGCTIISNAPDDLLRQGAGGVAGMGPYSTWPFVGLTVRDTTITARNNAGGLIGLGFTSYTNTLRQSYVAEDVTVTAQNSAAGGLIGTSYAYVVEDCACGANVSVSGGDGAGGLIGVIKADDVGSGSMQMKNCYYVGKVSASGNYAAGVIGKLDSTSVNLTADNLNGVVVAATVTATGTKTSLWLNDVSTYATQSDGRVYVWEQSVVSGQSAQSIVEAAKVSTTGSLQAIPVSGALVSAARFSEADFYKNTAGFTVARWDWDKMTKEEYTSYMPYPKAHPTEYRTDAKYVDGYVTLKDSYEKTTRDATTGALTSETSPAGILRPAGGTNPDATVVYASGVDTVNIEVAAGTTSITVETPDVLDTNGNPVTYTYSFAAAGEGSGSGDTGGTGDSGDTGDTGGTGGSGEPAGQSTDPGDPTPAYQVITLKYDYQTTLKVAGKTYTPDDLRRTGLTVSGSPVNYWYFIDTDSKVAAGSCSATSKVETLNYVKIKDSETTLTNVVHLWQGRALAENGTVYELQGYQAAAVTTDLATGEANLAQQATARPFWSYDRGTAPAVSVQVYHNFTLYGGTPVNHRIFNLTSISTQSDTLYTVSPYQDMVYDGVLLAMVTGVGDEKPYFALLGQSSKSLTSYLTAISTSNWSPNDLQQISNNLGCSSTVVVLRYGTANGEVMVVNYATGMVIYSNRVAVASFFAYARQAVSTMWRSFMGSTVASDDSLQNSQWTGEQSSPEKDLDTNSGDGGGGDGSRVTDGTAEWTPGGVGNAEGEETESGTGQGTDTPVEGQNGETTGSNGSGATHVGSGGADGSQAADGTVAVDGPGVETDEEGTETQAPGVDAAGTGTGSGIGDDSSVEGPLVNGDETDQGDESGSGDGDLLPGGSEAAGADGSAEGGGASLGGGNAVSEEGETPDEGGETAEDTESGENGAPGAEEGAAPEGGNGSASGGEAGVEGTEAAGTPETGESAVTLPDTAVYVPGVGLTTRSGKLLADEEETDYQPGRGVEVNGTLVYLEDEDAQTPTGAPEGTVTLITPAARQQSVLATLEDVVAAYDPLAGEYTACSAATLVSGEPRSSKTKPHNTAQTEELSAPAGNNDFTVGHGLGRNLTTEEQRGFALLGVAAAGALGIITALFFRLRKKKRS